MRGRSISHTKSVQNVSGDAVLRIVRDILFGLLFGKSVLLTPIPIDLIGTSEIPLTMPIEAVTSGASLQIDVSFQVEPDRNFLAVFEKAKKIFPPNTVKAELIRTAAKESLELSYVGPTASDTNVYLKLVAPNGVPTGLKFDRLRITTEKDIKAARVYWINFSK